MSKKIYFICSNLSGVTSKGSRIWATLFAHVNAACVIEVNKVKYHLYRATLKWWQLDLFLIDLGLLQTEGIPVWEKRRKKTEVNTELYTELLRTCMKKKKTQIFLTIFDRFGTNWKVSELESVRIGKWHLLFCARGSRFEPRWHQLSQHWLIRFLIVITRYLWKHNLNRTLQK